MVHPLLTVVCPLPRQVVKAFDVDWHAQLSLRPFTPPDTQHGYIFSFWGRMVSTQQAGGMPGHEAAPPRPKVVFQDADDEYTPLKQVAVPLTNDWNLFQVDLSIPRYRFGHAIVVSFWVGDAVGSFAFDDLEVTVHSPHSGSPPPHSGSPPHHSGSHPQVNLDETLNTLRYANRAKNIKNKPKINEDPKDALLR